MTATNIREVYAAFRTVSDYEDRSEAAYHACEPTIPAFVSDRNPHGTTFCELLLREIDRREAAGTLRDELRCGPRKERGGPCAGCGAPVPRESRYAHFCKDSCRCRWAREAAKRAGTVRP